MLRRIIVASVLIVAVACAALVFLDVSPLAGQSTKKAEPPPYIPGEEFSEEPGGVDPSAPPPAPVIATIDPQPEGDHEVWIAVRSRGSDGGKGTFESPYGANGNLSILLDRVLKAYGDNLTIHLGPGVFYGDHLVMIRVNNLKIHGAGRDITIFRTRADAGATDTVGFRCDEANGGISGVEVSDMTFDFNVPSLRKANRVFTYLDGKTPRVYYQYVPNPPVWSDKQAYKRQIDTVVSHKGSEYVCVASADKEVLGKEPGQNEFWSILRPCDPAKLPAPEKGKTYSPGDAVSADGKGFICIALGATPAVAQDTAHWQPIRTDYPDPRIYTHAVFVNGRAPKGNHRVYRCKAVHGHGSSFLGRESFIFGLGGNDCAIEDCQVADFVGDYGSLIVIYCGQNNAVRYCSVRGNGGIGTMAYGGWALHDSVFESNYCNNVSAANNIDSLTCRNVTYRGNRFFGCKSVGILINVQGRYSDKHTLVIDGKEFDTAANSVDGLYIYDNIVELADDCPYGGIQVHREGLRNVKIYNNVIRTHDGTGHGRRAIGVWVGVTNVQISNNTCDPNMYCEIASPAFGWNNVDLTGTPIKGLEKVTEPKK